MKSRPIFSYTLSIMKKIILFGLLLFLELPVRSQETPLRWLGLEGALNARDAGGYRTQDGSRLRWGVLYRSNQLGTLTETGQDRFRALGIKTVVDFRMVSQVAAQPDVECVSQTATYHHFPIGIDGVTGEEIYSNIVTRYAEELAQAFRLLAKSENLPFLCHCVVGKDRTGVFIALVHRLLGVSSEDILADYLLSNEIYYWVYAEWLQVVLTMVDEEGGIETFLTNRGVDIETQMAIRSNLLEPVSGIDRWDRIKTPGEFCIERVDISN